MIDQNEMIPVLAKIFTADEDVVESYGLRENRLDLPFSRSNGTALSRIYERLTKASRRRATYLGEEYDDGREEAYRQGVYDAFKALQEELQP